MCAQERNYRPNTDNTMTFQEASYRQFNSLNKKANESMLSDIEWARYMFITGHASV